MLPEPLRLLALGVLTLFSNVASFVSLGIIMFAFSDLTPQDQWAWRAIFLFFSIFALFTWSQWLKMWWIYKYERGELKF